MSTIQTLNDLLEMYKLKKQKIMSIEMRTLHSIDINKLLQEGNEFEGWIETFIRDPDYINNEGKKTMKKLASLFMRYLKNLDKILIIEENR